MKPRLLVAALLSFLFSTVAIAQTKLVEKVVKKGDELVIPYEKYVLSNGLTLIIHEDHSDPVAHVDVTYHVGSAREEIGKSGFAHFFEHMMFQGSDHVGDEQHFKIVSDAGGTLNGSTNRDRTNSCSRRIRSHHNAERGAPSARTRGRAADPVIVAVNVPGTAWRRCPPWCASTRSPCSPRAPRGRPRRAGT